jgi:hypothetical protein
VCVQPHGEGKAGPSRGGDATPQPPSDELPSTWMMIGSASFRQYQCRDIGNRQGTNPNAYICARQATYYADRKAENLKGFRVWPLPHGNVQGSTCLREFEEI